MQPPNAKGNDEAEEVRRLKKELARVTEERDILKKRPRISPRMQSEVRVHCPASFAVLGANDVPRFAGSSEWIYAWLKNPLSRRASEDERQTDLLRKAWEESGKVSGYRKLHDDLLDQGEVCCPNRVARLTRIARIKAQIGYKRRPGIHGGRPSVVVDNTLDRQFDVAAPDKAWVTDITHIRICEGIAYLAVVIDLYSCHVIGWAMQSRQTTDVVLRALLMAVWRRKPKEQVLIHSDQGS